MFSGHPTLVNQLPETSQLYIAQATLRIGPLKASTMEAIIPIMILII